MIVDTARTSARATTADRLRQQASEHRHRYSAFLQRLVVEFLQIEAGALALLVFFARIQPSPPANEISGQLAGGQLRALHFGTGFFFLLKCFVDHEVHRFHFRHAHGLKTNVEDRIGNHPQELLVERESKLDAIVEEAFVRHQLLRVGRPAFDVGTVDRKSTRLNSSHLGISYAVFCLKKKKKKKKRERKGKKKKERRERKREGGEK